MSNTKLYEFPTAFSPEQQSEDPDEVPPSKHKPKELTLLSTLFRLLRDPCAEVRTLAARALANASCSPQRVVPELLRIVARESNPETSSPKSAAFRALIKLGVRFPDQVIPILLCELSTDSVGMKNSMYDCLCRIGIQKRELIIRYLGLAIASDNRHIRNNAVILKDRIESTSDNKIAKVG